MEMAQAEEKHQNLEEKHQDLRERVARLQAQFDHLNDNIRGIDQELTKVRDRLLTHEREGIKEQVEIRIEQEQIRSQLQRILDRLDWMLGDIQRSRQVWADQPSDPEVQRLLEVLRNASNQIGGKRRSIKTLLEKLTDPTPKSGVGDA